MSVRRQWAANFTRDIATMACIAALILIPMGAVALLCVWHPVAGAAACVLVVVFAVAQGSKPRGV